MNRAGCIYVVFDTISIEINICNNKFIHDTCYNWGHATVVMVLLAFLTEKYTMKMIIKFNKS